VQLSPLAQALDEVLPNIPAYSKKNYVLSQEELNEVEQVLTTQGLQQRSQHTQAQAIQRIAGLFPMIADLEQTRFRAVAGYLEIEKDFLLRQIEEKTGEKKPVFFSIAHGGYQKAVESRAVQYENVGRPQTPFNAMIRSLQQQYIGDIASQKTIEQAAVRELPVYEAAEPTSKAKTAEEIKQRIVAECEHYRQETATEEAVGFAAGFGETMRIDQMAIDKESSIEMTGKKKTLADFFIFKTPGLAYKGVQKLLEGFDKAAQQAVLSELTAASNTLREQYVEKANTDKTSADQFAIEEAGSKLLDIIEKNTNRKASIIRMLRILGHLKSVLCR